jgi:hypothetical protein
MRRHPFVKDHVLQWRPTFSSEEIYEPYELGLDFITCMYLRRDVHEASVFAIVRFPLVIFQGSQVEMWPKDRRQSESIPAGVLQNNQLMRHAAR